jgi:hypothetical protein
MALNDKALRYCFPDTGFSIGGNMTELQSLRSDVQQYAEVTARLAAHALIRSNNKPQGDIAEAIAAEALGGTLLDQSAKGADLKLPDGKLLQVKSVTDYGKAAGTSAIRSTNFDQLLVIVFDPLLAVKSAHLYTREQAIEAMSKRSQHTNASVIRVGARSFSLGEDVTQKLKRVWY